MKRSLLVVSLCLATFFPAVLRAQPGTGTHQGLSATATESVPIKAERLRLVMLIKAQGADAKSAIVALLEHKQRVQKELEAMKAEKESIEFTSTRMGGDSDQDAQMLQVQRQLQMQMANSGVGNKPALPTVYTASCGLKAEWTLPGSEGDALALLPTTLSEQIKARDLAGENNKPKLSKAAQEQLEEMETMIGERYAYSNNSEPLSKIVFVAAIPEEAKKKVTAAAFAKLSKEVDALAESTGQKRGKLLALSTENVGTSNYAQMVRAYSGIYGQADTSPTSVLSKFEKENTVSSANADELSLTVSVSATYAIE